MTPQPPPHSNGDPGLLALAAAIAADHRPGLHPIDLIVAARYGFTNDQAHAILDAPHLLSRLTRYWHSHPPTGTIIQIAQSGDAIGKAHPVGFYVETFGTEHVPVEQIQRAVLEVFDLRPAAIIRDLDLKRPVYTQVAAYGHFGRELSGISWESVDRSTALAAAVRG